MTRWARGGKKEKKTLTASSWEDLKEPIHGAKVKRIIRSEQRRLKRIKTREHGQVCFHCREHGHTVSDCPKTQNSVTQGTGICFKCGSTEHSVAKCRAKVPAGHYPHATCFVCNQQGHLSKNCPDNPRKLYPEGGSCKLCGSVEHFKKDCPTLQKKTEIKEVFLLTVGPTDNVEIQDDSKHLQRIEKPKKLPKIVKF